jgi:hypothetical protein
MQCKPDNFLILFSSYRIHRDIQYAQVSDLFATVLFCHFIVKHTYFKTYRFFYVDTFSGI